MLKKKIYSVLLLILINASPLNGNSDFGYISYTTTNIGDDIQALAAKRFLPKDSVPIDRDFSHEFKHPRPIHAIVNGWFMHTKEKWGDRAVGKNDFKAPDKSWPPSSIIDPLLISIHFTNSFAPMALTEEGIEYLSQNGPVGARDLYTLGELEKRGVPSYFSGCLTLTLDEKYKSKKRNNVIYCVDIDRECIEYVRANTKSKVVVISHGVPGQHIRNNEKRLAYAESLLKKYGKAKCVITTRLHAALPCLALETPVLFLGSGGNRFGGLKSLLRTCTKKEMLSGDFDFNFNRPTPNSKDYLPIRNNLINTVNKWVRECQD